jgi:uncharacterized protein YndB with AHSA1/START domain
MRETVMNAGAKSGDFVMSRVFNAPRDLVWKVFTDVEHMKHWWGPKGFTVVKAEMDLRPGGTYHYAMLQATWPTGDAFDVHFRGHGRRQDTLHRALGNA